MDSKNFQEIPILKMKDNGNDLPVFIRKYTLDNCFSTPVHSHEYIQVNYILTGSGYHRVNACEFEVIKGDIFVIPPFVAHQIRTTKSSQMQIIEFEFTHEFINQNFESFQEGIKAFFDFAYIEPFLVSEAQVKPRLNLVGRIKVQVENILNDVLLEYKKADAGFLLYIKAALLKLLVVVGREYQKELNKEMADNIIIQHREEIVSAMKYIEEKCSEDLTVDRISKKFTLSKSYFSKLFKQLTNRTFVEYITDLRIAKAMDLLKNTDMKVIDICYESGFNNINHFNRIFKGKTNISPTKYRKEFKKYN